MSLPTHTKRRLPQIKTGLLKGENYTTIGKRCGVTERTIDRDVKAWFNSGDFENWIREEWIRLHGKIIDENPELAYKEISRLMSRMVTQKQRITADVQVDLSEEIEQIIEFSRKEENP